MLRSHIEKYRFLLIFISTRREHEITYIFFNEDECVRISMLKICNDI